ncbi:MAG: sensor histidine kinase [Syntrophales bacterium]|nr:sensor histidine kinase [Syntrophales bacterium]
MKQRQSQIHVGFDAPLSGIDIDGAEPLTFAAAGKSGAETATGDSCGSESRSTIFGNRRGNTPRYLKPPVVLAFLAIWIFLAEVVSMIILNYHPQSTRTEEIILDGIILLILISPSYLFLYRPLKAHWSQRLRYEKEVRFLGRKLLSISEEERHRLASELHDECGGLLSTLQLKMETLKHYLSHDPLKSREQADQVIGIVNQLSTHLRSILNQLRPVALEQFGLVPTLSKMIKEFASQWPDMEIDFQTKGLHKHLRPEVNLTLFYICQEALGNATRHAKADRIDIRLETDESWVILSIKDDGRGIVPDRATAHCGGEGGFGLLGMRERAVLLGGTFELLTAPGGGTLVCVRLPLVWEEAE